jgi:uncharacterized membrane protein
MMPWKRLKMWLYSAFGLYALTLAILGLAAPLFAAIGQWELSTEIMVFLSKACHQNPVRSFWLCGHPVALCGRCLGVYFGTAAGVWAVSRGYIYASFLLGLAMISLGFMDKALLFFFPLDAMPWLGDTTIATALRSVLGTICGLGISLVIGSILRLSVNFKKYSQITVQNNITS